jgi:hypothetical protein
MSLCLLHILELLNIGHFAPLKQVYSREIRGLVLDYISRINKKAFIKSSIKVFKQAFLKANIIARFQATRLVPRDRLVMLLKLNIKVYTLILLLLEEL